MKKIKHYRKAQKVDVPAAKSLSPTPAAAPSSAGLTVARLRVHWPSQTQPTGADARARRELSLQGAGGEARLPGLGAGPGGRAGASHRRAGPRRPGRGLGAGTGRRPAHVGGWEQLKVRSGDWAVLSRAALAGEAAEEEGVRRQRKRRGGPGRRRTGADRRCELPGAQS